VAVLGVGVGWVELRGLAKAMAVGGVCGVILGALLALTLYPAIMIAFYHPEEAAATDGKMRGYYMNVGVLLLTPIGALGGMLVGAGWWRCYARHLTPAPEQDARGSSSRA
jgi:hypothetical protein